MSEAGIPVKNTGFQFGYFRIRAPGASKMYLVPHGYETRDGNALVLWSLDRNKDAYVYFINPWGALCCKDGGVSIDVINDKLVIAHNRPTTIQQWPSPWSHYLPTFSYSGETKMITIQFHADPVLSNDWPRPESEWKDKEVVVAARPPKRTSVCKFAEIARWAPASTLPPLWTTQGGDQCGENNPHSVAVEEKLENVSEDDLKRMRWEIETDI